MGWKLAVVGAGVAATLAVGGSLAAAHEGDVKGGECHYGDNSIVIAPSCDTAGDDGAPSSANGRPAPPLDPIQETLVPNRPTLETLLPSPPAPSALRQEPGPVPPADEDGGGDPGGDEPPTPPADVDGDGVSGN